MVGITSHRSWAALLGMAAGVTALAMAGSAAQAAMLASDSASNYTGSTWPGAANTGGTSATTVYSPTSGGTGFGAWTVNVQNNQGPPYAGTFFGNNKGVNVSSSGAYFGLYANGAVTTTTPNEIPRVDAMRAFENAGGTGLGTLRAGQAFNVGFEIQTGNYGIGDNAGVTTGVSLDTITAGTSTPVFTLAFHQDSANNYALVTTITDASGSTSYEAPTNATALTEPQIEAGINVSFALGNSGAYALTLAPATGNTALSSPLTYSGTVSGAINGADIFDASTNANAQFNNLSITTAAVPEPATIGLFVAAGAGLLLIRRRRSA